MTWLLGHIILQMAGQIPNSSFQSKPLRGLVRAAALWRHMRALYCLFLALAVAWSPGNAAHVAGHHHSVLFVGNSLTYVGNTPAVFNALATANGFTVSSDMLVKGGATLAQRVSDGSVARALASKRYTAVVLQERGGDLMCSFGPSSCVDSRKAIQALASLAKKAGAKAYLLGTYQGNPRASESLVAAESAAAAEAGIPYLEVSLKLQGVGAASPATGWFAPDGMHPGPNLALLNAAILHHALLGKLPRPAPLTVTAPIYGTTSGLAETIRGAETTPPLETTPRSIEYSAESLQVVLRLLDAGAGS